MDRQTKNRIRILNIDIDNISSAELLQKLRMGGVLLTPNVDHLMKLQKDDDFHRIYQRADYVVCDSKIVHWASSFLGDRITEKISGSDFFPQFCQYYRDDRQIEIFLLGGTNTSAKQAQQQINSKIGRQIVVGAYSPSIGFEQNERECQQIIDAIARSGATVLAVGVGAPKQEKWIDKYKHQLPQVKIFLAIGATIDFEAGITRRAPQWMSQVGLEWLYRLMSEPKRLWKRYLVESLPFFWLLWKQKRQIDRERRQLLSVSSPSVERKLNITMFGPSLLEKGGMGTVQKQILTGVRALQEKDYTGNGFALHDPALSVESWNSQFSAIKIEHLPIWNGKTSTIPLFFKAVVSFLEQLLSDRVDLVHIHMSERGSVLRTSILALMAFAFDKPAIVHAHGCEFHLFHDSLPRLIKELLNKILQNCAGVIVLSESWKQTYIQKCNLQPDRVMVLYNPVAMPQAVPQRSETEKITFLAVGKINRRKGVYDLFQAIAQLDPHLQAKMELILAGSGEIEKATALAKKLEIESRVKFCGWVNAQKRNQLLAKADVFVLPSYNEGLPMALLEAMSWGLPAITTPVGGIAEIVTDRETGILVEPGNVGQLATSMKFLIDNRCSRLDMGAKARSQIAHLEVKQYSAGLLNLYRSVANSRKKLLFVRSQS